MVKPLNMSVQFCIGQTYFIAVVQVNVVSCENTWMPAFFIQVLQTIIMFPGSGSDSGILSMTIHYLGFSVELK